ncbi:hypothetical protein MASR2M74_20530 [Paracoccaceae bacterium]
MAHVPLCTLWRTGTRGDIAYAVIHCTLGDIMIAATWLGGALFVFGRNGWPERNHAKVAVKMIAATKCYTVFSDWLNVEVRRSWAYRGVMPTLPIIGTGKVRNSIISRCCHSGFCETIIKKAPASGGLFSKRCPDHTVTA